MLRGLWKLTWLEIKIFLREPLGAIGTLALPILVFVFVGRAMGRRGSADTSAPAGFAADVPVLAAILITLSAVLSLVMIIAIYREGGILKRLRATPLRPHTILTAHVLVKLIFAGLTLAGMVLAGARYYPIDGGVRLVSFAIALLVSTTSVLSLGFVIASMVPTPRFAQPVSALLLYPMLGLSGLFVPVEALPAALQRVAAILPLTYAVSLLRGMWRGNAWSAHVGDVAVLALVFVVCLTISARVFRWE